MRDKARRKKTLHSGTGENSSNRRKPLVTFIVCVSLAVGVWIVFGQTLRHDFVNYDDDDYIHRNPRVVNGLNLDGIGWAFTHVHSNNWHPLTTISHMLDCQFYRLDSWGHHLTNVLLHIAASILLLMALRELTGAYWRSAFVAAVFAIHPLHVESVAWVAERKDVLSGIFFMLTLWTYGRYVHSRQRSSGRYALVIILFALGLLCKPTLVTLPFVMLLLDYWPLRRVNIAGSSSPARSARTPITSRHQDRAESIRDLVVEKIPFFVLSLASCIATALAQQGAVVAMRQLTFGGRVANAIVSYVAYIGQMIWPLHLAVIYPYRPGYPNMAQIILGFVVLLAVSVVVFMLRRKFPYLLIGWLWFLGVLVPMIGIVQVGAQIRADRYTYLSQIGLYVLITWGAVDSFVRWRRGREALVVIGLLILTALTAMSCVQAAAWQNSETIWNQALSNTSDNYIAENNLGNALMRKGQTEAAVPHFQNALEINPDYAEAKYHVAFAQGYLLASKGGNEAAIASFEEAIRIQPDHPNAHQNLAVALAGIGRTNEAIEQLREAVRLDPDYYEAHCNLATILAKAGQRGEAIAQFREALRIKPGDNNIRAQLRKLEASH